MERDRVQKLYAELAELLEVDEVKPDDVLLEFDTWDSLTQLSVLAALDAGYGIHLTARELRQARTVGELVARIEDRIRA
jgi:acyl carrier protein